MTNERTEQRLNELESALSYLQNDYDALNETVLENTNRLKKLTTQLERIANKLEGVADSMETPRRAEDEKPPHY